MPSEVNVYTSKRKIAWQTALLFGAAAVLYALRFVVAMQGYRSAKLEAAPPVLAILGGIFVCRLMLPRRHILRVTSEGVYLKMLVSSLTIRWDEVSDVVVQRDKDGRKCVCVVPTDLARWKARQDRWALFMANSTDMPLSIEEPVFPGTAEELAAVIGDFHAAALRRSETRKVVGV